MVDAPGYTPIQIRAVLLAAIGGSVGTTQGVEYFFSAHKDGTRPLEKSLAQLRQDFEIHKAVNEQRLDNLIRQIINLRREHHAQ